MLNLEERVCTELWVVVVVLCSLLYFINDRFLIVWFVLLMCLQNTEPSFSRCEVLFCVKQLYEINDITILSMDISCSSTPFCICCCFFQTLMQKQSE